jgi:hypothetical protein
MTSPLPNEGDERVCDWVDGTMTPRDKERFEAEMRVSKFVLSRAEAYRRTVVAVREGLSQDDGPVDVADAVLARIRGGVEKPVAPVDPTGPTLPRVPGAWWRSALVAAAMLALIFVLDRWEPRATAVDTARAESPATLARPDSRVTTEAPSAGSAGVPSPALREQGAVVQAPRTMVPQVTLRRGAVTTPFADAAPSQAPPAAERDVARADSGASADKATAKSEPKPKAETQADTGGVAEGPVRFGGADVLFGDLADSVRAIGAVRLQALAPAAEGQAQHSWVATGREADLRAFLADVSAAAAAFGYAVENGEARAAEVDARTPLAKADAKPASGSDPEGALMRVVIVLERPAK